MKVTVIRCRQIYTATRFHRFLFVAACAGLVNTANADLVSAANAQANDASTSASTSASTASTSASTSASTPLAPAAAAKPPSAETKVLTAGASIVHVELGNVRDILLDVRRAKVAATHLYGEVTRHPITSYNYVDAMGPVMMEIPMPTFDMSEVLPARREWVDLYMQEITPALNYIKADGTGIKNGESSLNFSDKVKTKFDALFQDASASIDKATSCGAQLQKLTTAPPYDNLAIAKQTSELHKDLREVERTTKHLIGEIKKSNSK